MAFRRRYKPVQHPANLGLQEPAHVPHQRAEAIAVTRFSPSTLLAAGDHRDQRVVAAQLPQPALAEKLALAGDASSATPPGPDVGQCLNGHEAMAVLSRMRYTQVASLRQSSAHATSRWKASHS